MKKIALVGPCYPYRGGNSLFMTHLYHALSGTFEVKMYNYSLLYPSILFPGTTQFDESNKTINPVPNERVLNSINPLSWIKTARKIKSDEPDLIVFDWWNPFFGLALFGVCAFLGSSMRRKSLFITENVISHEGRWIDRFLTRVGLHFSSAFLALSAVVERDLDDIKGSRPVYRSELPVYNCYDMDPSVNRSSVRGDLNYSEHDFVILFFGYIRRYKGLDVLLRSVPELLKHAPNAQVLVVGESYDDLTIYTSITDELGISNCVRFVNQYVPNEEVGRYYAACDLVVLPYREATQSGILNIAYGFEKPVVVTRVGGLADLVDEEKTGIVVQPESPTALAKGILRFMELRRSVTFEENIRKRVSSNAFSGISELFKNILASKS